MSAAKPVHLNLTRTQAGTVALALVADVRKWSADGSAADLLADAWDALEAVTVGMGWLHVGERPGEDLRDLLARHYGLSARIER